MGLFSNSVVAHPYQNWTWVPPSPEAATISDVMISDSENFEYNLTDFK